MLGSITAYPLPYGVTIVREIAPNDYYTVPRSQTICWPWTLGSARSVKIAAQHVSFYNNQQNTVRMWCSLEPNGRSITIAPYAGLESIRLNGDGYVWNFYDVAHPENRIDDVNLNQWIDPAQTYFINAQNLENRDNHAYLKIIYL
jgi:hypothetical protein